MVYGLPGDLIRKHEETKRLQREQEQEARLRAMEEVHRQEREHRAAQEAREQAQRAHERVIRRDVQEDERLRDRKIKLHRETVRPHVKYGPRQDKPRPVTKPTGLLRKRGGYARAKLKILWVLLYPQKYGLCGDCFTVRQLCIAAGVPIGTLKRKLADYEGGKWMKTKLIEGVKNETYGVCLGPRGYRYTQLCRAQLRNYQTFARQFEAWQQHLRENGLREYLDSCPYKDCVFVLSRDVKIINSWFSEWVE